MKEGMGQPGQRLLIATEKVHRELEMEEFFFNFWILVKVPRDKTHRSAYRVPGGG
jgi:hypothetical protein